MALRILEDCTFCCACEEECTRSAIAHGDDRFLIDPALCDECAGVPEGPECVAACPIEGCIVPTTLAA